LIHEGEERTFNFFESMYPLNIRKDAENGLYPAFLFWNLPNTKKRFDELLDEFIFEYKDFDNNPECTYDTTKFGIVTMMRAIINLQRTILSCSEGIYDKNGFIDNTLLSVRSMSKEERDLTLMMELKGILWEVNVPSEYIKSLLQEELNSESFVVEKQQYRKRKNLLMCYRGIQFLLERKFEIFINITLFQKVILPMLKEMVMEEYLSDISNDMIICLLRAGTVIIRCEIWKHFLTVRDSLVNKPLFNSSMKNKKEADTSRSIKLKTNAITSYYGLSNADLNERTTNIDDKKYPSISEKMTAEMKFCENIESKGHKLAIHKPWFSHNLSIDNSISFKDIPVCDSSVLKESSPIAVQSIPDASNIYDIYLNTGTNQKTQDSSSTDVSRESRLRPRLVVDKISK